MKMLVLLRSKYILSICVGGVATFKPQDNCCEWDFLNNFLELLDQHTQYVQYFPLSAGGPSQSFP